MAFLDRSKLLEKEVLQIERVDLGKDDFVFVRQMTGRERDRFEQSLLKERKDEKGAINYERNLEDFRAKLAVNTMCKENGDILMLPDDYGRLSQSMSAAKLDKIVTKAQELNKITEEDKEKMVKNSESGQIDEGISESAGDSDTPTPTSGSIN